MWQEFRQIPPVALIVRDLSQHVLNPDLQIDIGSLAGAYERIYNHRTIRGCIIAAEQRAAVVYSLLATCKAHGVNERAWLEDVLRRIPEYEQAGKDYADLLPGNWSALSAK